MLVAAKDDLGMSNVSTTGSRGGVCGVELSLYNNVVVVVRSRVLVVKSRVFFTGGAGRTPAQHNMNTATRFPTGCQPWLDLKTVIGYFK